MRGAHRTKPSQAPRISLVRSHSRVLTHRASFSCTPNRHRGVPPISHQTTETSTTASSHPPPSPDDDPFILSPPLSSAPSSSVPNFSVEPASEHIRDVMSFRQTPRSYLISATKRARHLLSAYKFEEALQVWRSVIRRQVPDQAFASIMMNGFGIARHREGMLAVYDDWLRTMSPSVDTLISALFNLERVGEFDRALQLYDQHKGMLESEALSQQTLLLLYLRTNKLAEAYRVHRHLQQRGVQLPPSLLTTYINTLGAQRRYDDIVSLVTELQESGTKINEITLTCVIQHVMNERKYMPFALRVVKQIEENGDSGLSSEGACAFIRRLVEMAMRHKSLTLLDNAVRRWKARAKIDLADPEHNPRQLRAMGDLAYQLLETTLSLAPPVLAEDLLNHPAMQRLRTPPQLGIFHRKLAICYAREYEIPRMLHHYERATEVIVCDARAYNTMLAACIHAKAWSTAERLIADLETYNVSVASYLASTIVHVAAKANLPSLGLRYWRVWQQIPREQTKGYTEIFPVVGRLVATTEDLALAREVLHVLETRGELPAEVGLLYSSLIDAALKKNDFEALEEFMRKMSSLRVIAPVRVHDLVFPAYETAKRVMPDDLKRHLAETRR